jgi:signal transduction histidine kinase
VARLDLLQKTVREANDLIQNLLQTTRPILSQGQIVSMKDWFAEIRLAFETGFPQTTLEIKPSALLTIDGDPVLLRRLFLNLLGNAAQAGARMVTMTLVEEGDHLKWTVADDGPGLPAQIRPHLFLPGNTSRTDGSGLGLYNARRMAIAMGGRLTLEETGEAGTRFGLFLPKRREDSLP